MNAGTHGANDTSEAAGQQLLEASHSTGRTLHCKRQAEPLSGLLHTHNSNKWCRATDVCVLHLPHITEPSTQIIHQGCALPKHTATLELNHNTQTGKRADQMDLTCIMTLHEHSMAQMLADARAVILCL